MKKHILFSLAAVAALILTFSHCDNIKSPATLRLQVVQSDGRAGTIPLDVVKDIRVGIYLNEVFPGNLYGIYTMAPNHTVAVSVPAGVPLNVVLLVTNKAFGQVIMQGQTSEPVIAGGGEEAVAYINLEYLVPQVTPSTPMSVVVYPDSASPSTFDVHWQPEFSVTNLETMRYILSRARTDIGAELSDNQFSEVVRINDANSYSDPIAASYDRQNFTIYYRWQVYYDDFGLESVIIESTSLVCPWLPM